MWNKREERERRSKGQKRRRERREYLGTVWHRKVLEKMREERFKKKRKTVHLAPLNSTYYDVNLKLCGPIVSVYMI